MSSKLKSLRVVLFALILAFSLNANASGDYKNDRKNDRKEKKKDKKNKKKGKKGNNTKGDAVPLDGGLGILVLGAAAFGVKKLRDKKND